MLFKQIISMLMVLGLFTACAKTELEEVSTKTGTISLGTVMQTGLKSDIPVDAILVTITDANGQLVMENKRIQLYAFGTEYFTEGIELGAGGYLLTGFVVVNASNDVVYIAPRTGSEFAHAVKYPLPIKFMIYPEEQIKIVPEVIDVNNCDCTPSDLGYVAFSFDVQAICPDSTQHPQYILHVGYLNYAWGATYKGHFLSEDGVIRTFTYGGVVMDATIAKDPVTPHLITITDGYADVNKVTEEFYLAKEDRKIDEYLKDSIVYHAGMTGDSDLHPVKLGMADFGSITVHLYKLDERMGKYKAVKLYEYSDMLYAENREPSAQELLKILERYQLLKRSPVSLPEPVPLPVEVK